MKDAHGRVIRDKVYCGICQKDFKYTGTGGNFLTHLKNLHSITEHSKKPQDPAGPSKTVKIDSVFLPKHESKYRSDNPR